MIILRQLTCVALNLSMPLPANAFAELTNKNAVCTYYRYNSPTMCGQAEAGPFADSVKLIIVSVPSGQMLQAVRITYKQGLNSAYGMNQMQSIKLTVNSESLR